MSDPHNRQRYDDIAKSQWFAKAYNGRSLGETLTVVPENEVTMGPFDGPPRGKTCQRCNLGDILSRFAWQTDHEIELDQSPAGLIDRRRSGEQISLGDALVYNPPHPIAASLGGQRKSGLTHFFYLVDQFIRQAPYPQ